MNNNNNNTQIPDSWWGFLIILLLMIGIALGSVLGGKLRDSHWQRKMVERGYAEYNQSTAEWQWKTNLVLTNITYFKN